jgi:hypothetical protein
MTYLSEVWGVNSFDARWDTMFATDCLERQYLDFHRFVLGVNKKVRREMVFAEFGKYPLCLSYWKSSLTFWNKTVATSPSRLSYMALVDSVECYCNKLDSKRYKVCWFSGFVKVCSWLVCSLRICSVK